jgi:hypothetical protein
MLLGMSPIYMESTDIESNNTNTNNTKNEIGNISNKDGNGSRSPEVENHLAHKSQIESQKGGTPVEVEDNIPSPYDYTASSVNETNQFFTATFNIKNSPTQIILTGILILAMLSMFLNIVFLVQLFNRFILNSNFDYILGLVDKYVPNKHKERVKNWFVKGNEKNNRFYFIMFIINSILLIIILLMIIVATILLLSNLDHLCEVHTNYFANKK